MLPFSSLHHHDVIIPRSRILHFECHMRTGESRDNMLPAVIEQECPRNVVSSIMAFRIFSQSGIIL